MRMMLWLIGALLAAYVAALLSGCANNSNLTIVRVSGNGNADVRAAKDGDDAADIFRRTDSPSSTLGAQTLGSGQSTFAPHVPVTVPKASTKSAATTPAEATPPVEPTAATDPAPEQGEPTAWRWNGPWQAPAAVADTAVRVTVSGWGADGVTVACAPWPPSGWPACKVIAQPDEQCMAHCVLIHRTADGYLAQHWDHMCASPCGRDWGNIWGQTDGQDIPPDSADCWVMLTSCNGARRSVPTYAGKWVAR